MMEFNDHRARPEAPAADFDSLAAKYDRFISVVDHPTSPIRGWLIDHLGRGDRALDVGCGAGRNSLLLADAYREVLALDVSESMIRLARELRPHPSVTYECRDFLEVDPPSIGRFDLVFSFNSVFHMGETRPVLERLASLVRPRGLLLVIDVVTSIPSWLPAPRGYGYAGEAALGVFLMSGRIRRVRDTLRLMLDPDWMAMTRHTSPLTRAQFRRAYRRALPGVHIDPTLNRALMAVAWTAPAESTAPNPTEGAPSGAPARKETS